MKECLDQVLHGSRVRVLIATGTLVAGVLVGSPVGADEGTDAVKVRTAAQEFDAGRRAYTSQDYATAADHFENAYRDVPSVEALRLAIRSHRQAGHTARAATLAELAMRRYADDAGTVSFARTTLQEVRPKVFKLSVQCEPECGIVVDERAVFDETAEQFVVYLEPGAHRVAATWKDERGRAIEVQGQAGKETQAVFRAPSLDEDEVPPTTGAGGVQITGGTKDRDVAEHTGKGLPPAVTYIGMGLTAALAGATIWSGIDTRNHPGRDAVREQCIDQGESCSLYQDGLSRQRRTNILLGTTLGVAAVTSVVGLVYTRWGDDEPSSGASQAGAGVRVMAGVGWDGGPRLGAAGRF
jgi:hypothetical protein